MSKLIQVYSNSCGLKIGQPFLQEEFFPLTEERYITIQGGSGQQAKVYDYFAEVIEMLSSFLSQNKITVIQLGGKDDSVIKGAKSLLGITTYGQVLNILKNSIVHVGVDSWITHLAGAMGKPIVSVYGSTSVQNHGPYWKNSTRTTLIESHRHGNIPTYSNEGPKTVNFIPPEVIANAILKTCGINQTVNQKTVYINPVYNQTIVEYVPDFPLDPGSLAGSVIIARMDYHYDANNLFAILSQGRKVNIVTNKSIDINGLLQFKSSIVGLSYEVSIEDDPKYFLLLKKTGIKLTIFSRERDATKLSELRIKFFDVCTIDKVDVLGKDNFFGERDKYLNSSIDRTLNLDNLLYRSNKFMLSKGQIFPSKAAWKLNLPSPAFEQNVGKIIDSPEFWEEFVYYRIFELL